MKRISAALLIAALAVPVACKDFLDVNTNPNAPETVSPNVLLPALLANMVTSPQFDGRYIGQYTQQFHFARSTAFTNWSRMGHDQGTSAPDNGGQQWRDVYWSFGQNLVNVIKDAEAGQRWDVLGVGQILKAWGWLVLTDMHGEIIVKQAFDATRFSFDYDSQEYAYTRVFELLDSATINLSRTDGAVDATYLSKGDRIYNGDRTKWLKFAAGLRAIALNHFSNKSTYNQAAVIAAVNSSLASNSDDALLAYPGQLPSDDRNFWGQTRNNNNSFRQTSFVVGLMDGTQFGGVIDPRRPIMLSKNGEGQYRGLDINTAGWGGLTTIQKPFNMHGYDTTFTMTATVPAKYFFDDKSKIPAMTYSQLQFIKAEAAFRMGDKGTAQIAYKQAVSAHIGFVNLRNGEISSNTPNITSADSAAFVNNPLIVPSAAGLTLTHIMLQKYLAQWMWGHNEVWMDMRRYHYNVDMDPATGKPVYNGFTPPTTLYADNGGKLVWRIRPRYNSEYVWNRPGLDAIGGLAIDYQTKPTWIINP